MPTQWFTVRSISKVFRPEPLDHDPVKIYIIVDAAQERTMPMRHLLVVASICKKNYPKSKL